MSADIVKMIAEGGVLTRLVLAKGPYHFNRIHSRVLWFFKFEYNKLMTHEQNWANAITKIARADDSFDAL